jgi:hypothetical protein
MMVFSLFFKCCYAMFYFFFKIIKKNHNLMGYLFMLLVLMSINKLFNNNIKIYYHEKITINRFVFFLFWYARTV